MFPFLTAKHATSLRYVEFRNLCVVGGSSGENCGIILYADALILSYNTGVFGDGRSQFWDYLTEMV